VYVKKSGTGICLHWNKAPTSIHPFCHLFARIAVFSMHEFGYSFTPLLTVIQIKPVSSLTKNDIEKRWGNREDWSRDYIRHGKPRCPRMISSSCATYDNYKCKTSYNTKKWIAEIWLDQAFSRWMKESSRGDCGRAVSTG
jgi:hypothetical protein